MPTFMTNILTATLTFLKSTLAFLAAVNPLVWVGIAVALTAVIGFVVYRALSPSSNSSDAQSERHKANDLNEAGAGSNPRNGKDKHDHGPNKNDIKLFNMLLLTIREKSQHPTKDKRIFMNDPRLQQFLDLISKIARYVRTKSHSQPRYLLKVDGQTLSAAPMMSVDDNGTLTALKLRSIGKKRSRDTGRNTKYDQQFERAISKTKSQSHS